MYPKYRTILEYLSRRSIPNQTVKVRPIKRTSIRYLGQKSLLKNMNKAKSSVKLVFLIYNDDDHFSLFVKFLLFIFCEVWE